ncbi:unnamed protein product [Arabis nemorensis]|uniref:TF-B3 domain-containing protein n=1 Tax=Arabis nemorensis TaxID=586526 RepID=A0A565BT95_9BRAS|nr:unnamed protein product [Arabis nemorensis]
MNTPDSIPKFFRVYMPNETSDDMKLPLVSSEISGTPLPRKVTVKNVSSGNVWRMEMTTDSESDSVILRDGWKKIITDKNLKDPVILVCEFDGGTSKRRWYLKTKSAKFIEYLDDKQNPCFPVDVNQKRTRIPAVLIKDYNLKFPKSVIVRDKINKLKREIAVWKNRSVFLNRVGSIMRRNNVKPGDKVVFELKMVDGYRGLVREIKVQFVQCWAKIKGKLIKDSKLSRDFVPKIKVVDYAPLIQSLSLRRLPDLAHEVFIQLKSDNLLPNYTTLSALILCFAQNGSVQRARTIWDEILYSSFVPDLILISKLVSAYEQIGCFSEVAKITKDVSARHSKLLPIVCSLAICCFGKNGQLQLMEDTIELIDTRFCHC